MAQLKIFNGKTAKPFEGKFSPFVQQWHDEEFTESATVEGLYNDVSWLYACVNFRAKSITALPRAIVNESGEETPPPFPFHLTRLLYQSELSLSLYGAFYWMKQRNRRGQVVGVQYLNPKTIKPIYTIDEGLVGFERQLSSRKINISVEDMVYCWLPSVNELGAGVSPAEVAKLPAELLRNIDRFGASFFERGAVPATILSVPDMRREEDIERLERRWKKLMSGVKNAFNSIAMRQEVQVTTVGLPISELSMPELEESKRSMIASAFGLSPNVIDGTSANFATAQMAKRNALEDTIIPQSELIAESINGCLLVEFGLMLEFNPQALSIMQEDEEQRSGALVNLINAGMPLPVALRTLGYDLAEEDMMLIEGNMSNTADTSPPDEPIPVVADTMPVMMSYSEDDKRAELQAFKRWAKKEIKRAFEWKYHDILEIRKHETGAGVPANFFTKQFQTGNPAIDPFFAQYEQDLTNLLEEANADEIDEDETAERLAELGLLALLFVFLRGFGFSDDEIEGLGRDELQDVADSNLPVEALARLAEMVNQSNDSAVNFARDISAGLYRPVTQAMIESGVAPRATVQTAEEAIERLTERSTLWVATAGEGFATGQVSNPDNPRFVWVLGNTVEHCADCVRLDGQVHTGEEWLASGYLPQTQVLACGGWMCECRLDQTDAPLQGAF